MDGDYLLIHTRIGEFTGIGENAKNSFVPIKQSLELWTNSTGNRPPQNTIRANRMHNVS